MPESSDRLREIFMCFDEGREDDGIAKAENILRKSGWTIDRGMMTKPSTITQMPYSEEDQLNALEFLIGEWDYDLA